MYVSIYGELPVWTSLSKLSRRQRLAFDWPWADPGRHRRARQLFSGLFTLYVCACLIVGKLWESMSLPVMIASAIGLGLGFALLEGLAIAHHAACDELRSIRQDPRFRFSVLQGDAPGFWLAWTYNKVCKRKKVALSLEDVAIVHQWLVECWGDDKEVAELGNDTRPGEAERCQWEAVTARYESFKRLPLTFPPAFDGDCLREIERLRRRLEEELADIASMKRWTIDQLEMDILHLEAERRQVASQVYQPHDAD